MARPVSPWVWIGLGAVAVAIGGAAALFASSGDGTPDPQVTPSPGLIGMESGVRFELITGQCGYEVVVTGNATVYPEKGEFCLARLDVRNRGDAPASFDASCQFLIDATGTRHRQRQDVLPLDQVTAEFFAEELAPGVLAHDIGLYYDVDKGTQPDLIEMHTACDSPGVRLATGA